MSKAKITMGRLTKKGQREQLRYLSHSARLQETLPSHMAKVTIVAISFTVVSFVSWAAFANINEVARAPGEVVPQGFQQIVQHLEGGLVTEILVEEGRMVEKGDLLLRMKSTGATEDLGQIEEKQRALSLQNERLRAFIEDRNPDYSNIGGATQEQIASQQKMYNAMIAARQSERDVIEEQIKQKQSSISALQSRQSAVMQNLQITNDLLDRKSQLFSNGYVSKISYLETQQDANALKGENLQLGAQISEARSSVKEYRERLNSLDTRFRDEAWRQLETVEAEIAQNLKIAEKMKNRVDRQDIVAPVRGMIKNLNVSTVGGVAAPGQPLLEIIPMDRPMIVDIKISPRHIGHLTVGQPVQVKVSSFDYARYGAIAGELEYISASTFQTEQGDRYYKGRVRLAQNHVGPKADRNVVIPGMTVMADIVTGDKTIMQYLLKPIQNSLQTAMSER